MSRAIIDLPRVLMRVTAHDWDIDWGGQSAGADTGGGDQVVVQGFPRWVGAPTLVLPGPMVGHFRALRARVRGRINAWRVPMIDPVSRQMGGADWRVQWQAYLSGVYIEPQPKVRATAAAVAGASEILVDEAVLSSPVRVGAYLSYNDWPFLVTGRTVEVGATRLQVEMLRVAIPLNGQIDLAARGVFVATDGMAGNAVFEGNGVARADLSFAEWITR